MNPSDLIRTILTAALLAGVYSETGKWTTFSFFLISLVSEIKTYMSRKK